MNRISLILASMLFLLMSTQPAVAHHGFSQYFDPEDPARIEGIINKVFLGNPHSIISVADEQGVWNCEAQPMVVMARRGVDESTFVIGDEIVIEGFRSRTDKLACQVKVAHLSNGDSYVVRQENGRPWVVDEESMAAKAKEVISETNGIFGRWIRVIAGGNPIAPEFFEQITPAGREVNQAYDPFVDDPSLHCQPGPLFRAMGTPGQQTEIQMVGEQILISHEYMDAKRTVYLNGSEPDDAQIEPSEMGFSVGEFVDGELTIRTNNFIAGVLLNHVGDSGVAYSQDLEMLETISVDPETSELLYSWQATDKNYFGLPASGATMLTPSPYEMASYNCRT